ncbi:Rz1 family lipoprotein [Escherichia coli]|uniref:Rz1 family lipoprotein n=1 Tax=Escherichia coli TaxID=562 RepID=UPI0024BCBA03|nr:Rz1 family lipoprotein [Escherichia coli]WHO70593.1 Rz1 family lipoprotein [Escherichia coli]
MLPLVVVGCTSKQSVSQRVKPPPPRAWIMQPPPDWQTSLNRIISPSERGLSLCKNNCREPRSILMNSADRAPHIDGQFMQLL